MNLLNKISESELELMQILWREGHSVPFGYIRIELTEKMGWEKSTIATLLRRLVDKGVVSIQEKEDERIKYYIPNLSKQDYSQFKEKTLIDKLYEGSAKKLVAALCQRGELKEADIDELKLYFHMGENVK